MWGSESRSLMYELGSLPNARVSQIDKINLKMSNTVIFFNVSSNFNNLIVTLRLLKRSSVPIEKRVR